MEVYVESEGRGLRGVTGLLLKDCCTEGNALSVTFIHSGRDANGKQRRAASG